MEVTQEAPKKKKLAITLARLMPYIRKKDRKPLRPDIENWERFEALAHFAIRHDDKLRNFGDLSALDRDGRTMGRVIASLKCEDPPLLIRDAIDAYFETVADSWHRDKGCTVGMFASPPTQAAIKGVLAKRGAGGRPAHQTFCPFRRGCPRFEDESDFGKLQAGDEWCDVNTGTIYILRDDGIYDENEPLRQCERWER